MVSGIGGAADFIKNLGGGGAGGGGIMGFLSQLADGIKKLTGLDLSSMFGGGSGGGCSGGT